MGSMLMNLVRTAALAVFCLVPGFIVRGDPDPAAAKPDMDSLAAMASSLKWETGTITLKEGLAKINLTENFRFLDGADSQKVLHDMWGNPDDPSILGMIFPADKGPLDRDTWAVTVTYEAGGYMKDDDADKDTDDDAPPVNAPDAPAPNVAPPPQTPKPVVPPTPATPAGPPQV